MSSEKTAIQSVQTHPTSWEPSTLRVSMNLQMEAAIVPSATSQCGSRVDSCHMVVLDDFLDAETTQDLLDYLTDAGAAKNLRKGVRTPTMLYWTRVLSAVNCRTACFYPRGGNCRGFLQFSCGSQNTVAGLDTLMARNSEHPAGWDHSSGPPRAKWEQATCDSAVQGQRTWGLNSTVLDQLLLQPPPPVLEVQSRLVKTYPEVTIAHMPASMLQPEAAAEAASEAAEDSEQGARNPSASCSDGTGKAGDPNQEVRNGRKRRKLEEAGAGTGPGSPSGDQQRGRLDDEAELERKAEQGQQQAPDNRGVRGSFCSMFVGNAAVHRDEFSWHVDADPSSLPDSQWVDAFGRYFNREPGMPRFVSLLLYLNPEWSRSWDAETLILDTTTETGVFVRPKVRTAPTQCFTSGFSGTSADECAKLRMETQGDRNAAGRGSIEHHDPENVLYACCIQRHPLWKGGGFTMGFVAEAIAWSASVLAVSGGRRSMLLQAGRAVLMDQDLLHRVSPPSSAAGGWPRYSLVWKLVFLPRSPGPRSCSLARPEWGAATPFGSVHRLQQVKQQIAAGKVPGK